MDANTGRSVWMVLIGVGLVWAGLLGLLPELGFAGPPVRTADQNRPVPVAVLQCHRLGTEITGHRFMRLRPA